MKLLPLTKLLPLLLLLTLSTTASPQPTDNPSTSPSPSPSTTPTTFSPPRPIYAIAHRVLTPSSLTAALSHGANAIEVDLTAHLYAWYADHDNTLSSARSTATSLFRAIADARAAGSNISFVWLDIKNPDECPTGRACSIEALRDLARDVLGAAGIGLLYGFYKQEDSRGFRVISEGLRDNEAVVLSGTVGDVMGWFDQLSSSTTGTSDISQSESGSGTGGKVSKTLPPSAKQKAMDYGAVDLSRDTFGSCNVNNNSSSSSSSSSNKNEKEICSVLKEGSRARDESLLGSVMAWTTDKGEGWMVEKMLGETGVDGIIYGLSSGEYADLESVRAAYLDIEGYVARHPDEMRMATGEDLPW